MTADIITGKPPGGERVILADVLPLDTPLVVQVFPIYACNFKCHYCFFSIPVNKRGFVSDCVKMNPGLFKSIIDGMTFPRKVRVLRFVGMGEPLMHPDIARMVKYAVSRA